METFDSPANREKVLIGRLQKGERSAFAELYDRYGKSLYAVIFEVVKTEADAENLLQDCFVKIWRNIGRYDASKGRLYTWLVIIARRLALDFVRSAYFLERRMIREEKTAVSLESPAPEMRHLEYIGLESAVDRLDAPLKQMIDLQYFKGYTQQEVADETGLPLGTVKSRTRAAFMRLRQLLSLDS